METVFDQRKNNFDFIRMILAVLVIFSHSYPLGIGSETREPFSLLTRAQVTGGHVAVDLFFIISGFLITASFERSSTIWSYLKKRIYRIYPAFCVVALVSAVLVLPMSGGHISDSSRALRCVDVLVNTLRLREFNYSDAFSKNPFPDAINGSLWSIAYEFWCYIGVIGLGLSGALRSKRTLSILFAMSIAISLIFSVFDLKPGGMILGKIFGYPPFWARLLPMYLAGVVYYRFRHDLSLKTRWILLSCAGLALACVLPFGWSLLFPVVGPYLVLALAFNPLLRLHRWSRFGDFTYGTYLYAFPVQQLIMSRIHHPLSPFRLFLFATPITLCCAVISWHGVEKWFLRAKTNPTAP